MPADHAHAGDCEPRLPAVRLQVKKKNQNNGKWFYTCQKERKGQCGFFMFEDAAQAREKESVLGPMCHIGPTAAEEPLYLMTPMRRQVYGGIPQLSTPGNSFTSSGSTEDELVFAALADQSLQLRRNAAVMTATIASRTDQAHTARQATAGRASAQGIRVKRERDGSDDAEWDANFGDVDSEDERQMMQLADQSAKKHQDHRQTAPATPSAQRTRDGLGGLPTPVTRDTDQHDAKRQKMDNIAARGDPPSPAARSITLQPDGLEGDDYDITTEILGLLHNTPLTGAVRQGICETLNRFGLRMRGIERGREMARSVLRAKDERIAELQARVAALENERKISRDRIRALNSGLRALYADEPLTDLGS
jgi:hypothetical protein